MTTRAWVVLVLCWFGCERAKPPPPPAVVDAGTPVVEPTPPPAPEPSPAAAQPPAEPEVVADFPAPAAAPEDPNEALITQLLRDPREAEQELAAATAPDAFRVAILSALSRARGDDTFAPADPLLPLSLSEDGGVSAGAPAWTRGDAVRVLSKRAVPKGVKASLPLDTRVEVRALAGEWAEIEVPFAHELFFAAQGREPERVTPEVVTGWVQTKDLGATPLDLDALRAHTTTSPPDADALAAWQRLFRVERSAAAREGLLRAAFAQQRADTVVAAALARQQRKPRAQAALVGCVGTLPPKTTVQAPRRAKPGECVAAFDWRAACSSDPAAEKKRREAARASLDGVSDELWLDLRVDARARGQLFLVSTPLAVVDACADFEEVRLDVGAGRVRRLTLPLGVEATRVFVPVSRAPGLDHAVVSAASEAHAIEWLRSRERYRWTVGRRGELQPSLGVETAEFSLRRDADGLSFAVAPERSCGCPAGAGGE